MVQAKKSDTATGDEHEIDKIMKEIEDLEKGMEADAPAPEAKVDEAPQAASDNVVALHPNNSEEQAGYTEGSLVESDCVPVSQEPLMKSEDTMNENGNLSLKIGGCAEVSLEFERAGMIVTFQCSEDGLTITTDQGAEFRIPFAKKEAA